MKTKRWFEDHKVDIPEGKCGLWRVERTVVTKEAAAMERMRAMFTPFGRHVPEGTYTSLFRDNTLVMSDTPDEIRDHSHAIYRAQGEVLIAGLGIGMVAAACLKKPEVTRVTVVEIAPEVITLVGTHLLKRFKKKLEIVNTDIFDFKPTVGTRYGMVWFDIWDNLCTDNLDGMGRLHRKYARRADWYGSWGHEILKRRRREERDSWW